MWKFFRPLISLVSKRQDGCGQSLPFPDPELGCDSSSDPGLASFSAEKREHCRVGDLADGRLPSAYALRENFVSLIPHDASVLEIGPFTKPMLTGPNVKYLDVMDKAGLIDRAKLVGVEYDQTPTIHYVSSADQPIRIEEKFSAVVSSHCIEHQPDLVYHLNEVERLLDREGAYYAIIPDKRYCFDHFLPESSVADVLEANIEIRRVHQAGSVIEHRALTTHNDPVRHWRGDHGLPFAISRDLSRLADALSEIKQSQGRYIDVRAWQFTPESFRTICQTLFDLGLTRLVPVAVFGTPRDRFEFTAVLARKAGV